MTEEFSKISASIFKGSKAINNAFNEVINGIGHIDCTVTDFPIILPSQIRRKDLINIPLVSFNTPACRNILCIFHEKSRSICMDRIEKAYGSTVG